MVEKVKVRRRLASYEQKIKEEIKRITNKIQQMEDSCQTIEMERIWRRSTEYIELHTRWAMLNDVLSDICDIRCDEMLED